MNEQPALKYADGRVVEFEGIVVEEEVSILFVWFVALRPKPTAIGHGVTVSSPNHTFSCASLNKQLNQFFVHILLLVTDYKVSKGAEISNRYNQVPHQNQDTNGKVSNSQLITTNESQEVSPFLAGDHKAHINSPS